MLGRKTDGAEIHAGPTIDQLLGRELGQYTDLASLELALDGRDVRRLVRRRVQLRR